MIDLNLKLNFFSKARFSHLLILLDPGQSAVYYRWRGLFSVCPPHGQAARQGGGRDDTPWRRQFHHQPRLPHAGPCASTGLGALSRADRNRSVEKRIADRGFIRSSPIMVFSPPYMQIDYRTALNCSTMSLSTWDICICAWLQKYLIGIVSNPCVFIYFLPELAWEKVKKKHGSPVINIKFSRVAHVISVSFVDIMGFLPIGTFWEVLD